MAAASVIAPVAVKEKTPVPPIDRKEVGLNFGLTLSLWEWVWGGFTSTFSFIHSSSSTSSFKLGIF